MNRQRWLDYWQNIYRARLAFFPTFYYCHSLLADNQSGRTDEIAPGIYAGIEQFSWFIYKYDELAELAAVIDRFMSSINSPNSALRISLKIANSGTSG